MKKDVLFAETVAVFLCILFGKIISVCMSKFSCVVSVGGVN